MPTDAELRDLAVAELRQTGVGYKYFTNRGITPLATTRWGKALGYLEQIGQAPPAPPATKPAVGVYRWAANANGALAFGQSYGVDVRYVCDFAPGDQGWNGIVAPWWWLNAWKGQPWTLVFGVPPWPDGTADALRRGAAGEFDAYYDQLAANLASIGYPVIVRFGWEHTGDWYSWRAAGSTTDANRFAEMFKRAAAKLRERGVQTCWNPIWGDQKGPAAPVDSWPGRDYVDFIGVDVYQNWAASPAAWEERWQTHRFGWPYWQEMSRAEGRPLVIPEMGLEDVAHKGLGDQPAWIDLMADSMEAAGSPWFIYFDVDAGDGFHTLSSFPLSADRFRARFG